jgi:hypothetical protein
MQGLILTSGGIAVGFSGKELYLSEPFVMYAYPEGFRQVVDYDIVGLGYSGSTVFVLTTEKPYIMSGVSPETMTLQKGSFPQACVSRRSIVNIPGGCVYASPDGLVMLDTSGNCPVLTEQVYTKEQWAALDLSNMIGAYFDRKYYAFFSGETTALVFDLDAGAVRRLSIGAPVYDAIYDSADDALYLLVYDSGYKVYSLGAGDVLTYVYKTRRCRTLVATNMACARIYGDQSSLSPVTFELHCDGAVKHTRVVTDDTPFRLPGGFRTKDIAVSVQGKTNITLIELATSVTELKA